MFTIPSHAAMPEPLQRVLLHRPGAVLWRHADPADPRLWKNPWKRWKIHGNFGQVHGKIMKNPWNFRQIHGKMKMLMGNSMENRLPCLITGGELGCKLG